MSMRDALDPLTKTAITDRLEGWELIEFLQIPIEVIVDAFEDEILNALEDVEDFVNLKRDTNNNE